jgi:chromosome segregation ATPase
LEAKHKELMNVLKSAEDDDEKRTLHQTVENLHNQLDGLKMEISKVVEEKRVIEAERNAEKDLRERLHVSFEERTRRMEELQRAQLEEMKQQLTTLLSKTNQLESERGHEIMSLNHELKQQVPLHLLPYILQSQREKHPSEDTGRLMHKIKEITLQNQKLKQDLESLQSRKPTGTPSAPRPQPRQQTAVLENENEELREQIQHMGHQLDHLSKKLNQSMSRPNPPTETNKSLNQSSRKVNASYEEANSKMNRSRY